MTSAILGLLGGGIPTTLVIAWMNYKATDGPIFPPPLIAFFIVAPISAVLFLVQFAAVLYEVRGNSLPGRKLLGVGLACGLGLGLILYLLVISPYQSQIHWCALVLLSGLGTLMGRIVFGSQWLLGEIIQKAPGTQIISEYRAD
jgi:uncharacterized membrane protein